MEARKQLAILLGLVVLIIWALKDYDIGFTFKTRPMFNQPQKVPDDGVGGLSGPDRKHLEAAEGWLELGDHLAANEELDNIEPRSRAHPDVLEVRYQVFAKGEKWDACLAIAEALTEHFPKRVAGWIELASAMHHLGDTEGAYEALAAVGEEFAEHAEVTYALAVYAALTGQMTEAEDWLERALDIGGPKLKVKAMDDPNLKEFWQQIGERGT
jgi:tetratricopeptide (TPR) repeat protein